MLNTTGEKVCPKQFLACKNPVSLTLPKASRTHLQQARSTAKGETHLTGDVKDSFMVAKALEVALQKKRLG
jgi:hypothetical protein